MKSLSDAYSVAIACGGTGGHLFPGLAVAEKLASMDVAVTLIVSQKEVDQQAIKGVDQFKVLSLPAVGLVRGNFLSFARGFRESYRTTKKLFRQRAPDAVLAMGGFTSAPPVIAGKFCGAATFLHESNMIPGRANRWLSRLVDDAFVGFPAAAERLLGCSVKVTGTPARKQFKQRHTAACRAALGIDLSRPVMLVMGGSQGARGVNQMVARSLPLFAKFHPDWQWFHVAGVQDAPHLRAGYASFGLSAVVHPFFNSMEIALGAATAAISRAGASSLAELAAVRLPSLLVPFPAATDNHQWHNARAYVDTGAAKMLEEKDATSEAVTGLLTQLVQEQNLRVGIESALALWHRPNAAHEIAQHILRTLAERKHVSTRSRLPVPVHPVALDEIGGTGPRSIARARGSRPRQGEPVSI
jgi:UDP-N-acetylglucosamine--N-acetylmuramyl-(pentapeptide) pyrophosphoryl-undecaprenol N-acetylglucosamine transferase